MKTETKTEVKILITSFDPFGGETVNPAREAVQRLRAPEGVSLVRLEVPTAFDASAELVREAITREEPDAVLCVGQAGGRFPVTVERVAINIKDARIPDNDGAQPVDEPVIPGGPAAYFATLPLKAIVEALRAAGIPAAVSNTAGTYVCNSLLYTVLHTLGTAGRSSVPAGFIHVPYLPAQVLDKPDKPSMSLEMIISALEKALEVLAQAA